MEGQSAFDLQVYLTKLRMNNREEYEKYLENFRMVQIDIARLQKEIQKLR